MRVANESGQIEGKSELKVFNRWHIRGKQIEKVISMAAF